MKEKGYSIGGSTKVIPGKLDCPGFRSLEGGGGKTAVAQRERKRTKFDLS